jgi:hypothetical protein
VLSKAGSTYREPAFRYLKANNVAAIRMRFRTVDKLPPARLSSIK